MISSAAIAILAHLEALGAGTTRGITPAEITRRSIFTESYVREQLEALWRRGLVRGFQNNGVTAYRVSRAA